MNNFAFPIGIKVSIVVLAGSYLMVKDWMTGPDLSKMYTGVNSGFSVGWIQVASPCCPLAKTRQS